MGNNKYLCKHCNTPIHWLTKLFTEGLCWICYEAKSLAKHEISDAKWQKKQAIKNVIMRKRVDEFKEKIHDKKKNG